MKHYINFIKKFYLPLFALALIGLIYFGVNGVRAEFSTDKKATPQKIDSADRPLNIVAVDDNQTQNVVSQTPTEAKTSVEVLASPEVKNIPATEVKTPKIKVTMRVNAGSAAGNYVVDFKENESAFELLLRVAEVDYDMDPNWGAFVKAIGGLYNKGNWKRGSAWFFYVNAKPSEVGASGYTIKSNDLIEWKYEAY